MVLKLQKAALTNGNEVNQRRPFGPSKSQIIAHSFIFHPYSHPLP